ncbi:MAG: hypothetical protein Q8S18_01675 [Bacteroidales bacterium]|nr:hypothetical protein [Bacteroidales bacterium]
MKIKLKGTLPWELVRAGLKTGDSIDAKPCDVTISGIMHSEVLYEGVTIYCSIWPANYEIEYPKKNDSSSK